MVVPARAVYMLMCHFFLIGYAYVFNSGRENYALARPRMVAVDHHFAVGNFGDSV